MSTVQNTQPPENPLLATRTTQSVGEYFGGYLRRVRAGDLGALPIIIGLVVIAIIFQSQNENYLTPRNLVNMIVQMAGIATIAYGIVFVLLIGEIDLSVSYISAVGGVTMTLLLREPDAWPWFFAVPTALLITAGIGLLQGIIITTFRVPAFVVTLGGFLAWNGVVLILIGGAGTVIIQDRTVTNIANAFLPQVWGWIVAAVAVGFYAVSQVSQIRSRRRQGLPSRPVSLLVGQVIFMAAVAAVIVYISNQDRGVPFVGVLLLVFLVALTFLAENTQFGRFVYAVGGNAEAARRAGIRVQRIRAMVFTIAGLMAGMGGIILASRLRSVDTGAGGGNLLLNAIAAAVIGGTSLFGGRGKVYSALLGALVIASVENGMGLLGLSSGNKFIITGIILVIAVIVDSLSRRRQQRSGLA